MARLWKNWHVEVQRVHRHAAPRDGTQPHATARNGTPRHAQARNGPQRHATARNRTPPHATARNRTHPRATTRNRTHPHATARNADAQKNRREGWAENDPEMGQNLTQKSPVPGAESAQCDDDEKGEVASCPHWRVLDPNALGSRLCSRSERRPA